MADSSRRAAQALGITTSAMLSGAILSISYITIPSLLLAPGSLGVQQWRKMFDLGKVAAPPFAMLSSAAFGYLAYRLSKTLNQTKGELYGLAAISTLSIVPYTLILMRGVNGKLISKSDHPKNMGLDDTAANVSKDGEESAKELIDWWATLNVGRGLLPLVGTIIGTWATFA